MGNYGAIPTQNKKKTVCGSCLAPALLDRDELAIHKEVGVPKGRLCVDAMKYLDQKERSLMLAAASSNSDHVQALIKTGAPADTYDENRTSPLHIACRQGSIQVVRELLDHRAAIDITDCAGWTSLHIAAYSCRPDIVKLLLQYNADATIVNRNGETPWDLAADATTQQEFIQYWKVKAEEYESPRVSTTPKALFDITAKKAFPRPFSPAKKEKHKKLSRVWERPGEYSDGVIMSKSEGVKDIAVKIFNKNPFKGLAMLVVTGILPQASDRIAMFLFNTPLNKLKLGILLSDTDSYYQKVAKEFMGLFSFNKANLMLSLRKLFRSVKLPMEKIHTNNLIKCFAREFWDASSNFKSSVSVESLCLSIIMLDFSLHDHTSSPMSRSDFITSAAGMHDGEDFSEKYLNWVYEEVKKQSLQNKSEEKEENVFEADGHSGHLAYKGNRDWKERYFVLSNDYLWSALSNIASTPYSFIPLVGLAVHFDTRLQSFTISSMVPFPQFKIAENGTVFVQTASRLYFKAGNLNMWLEGFQTVPNIKLTIV